MVLPIKKLSVLAVLGITFFGFIVSHKSIMAKTMGITIVKTVGQVEVKGVRTSSWKKAVDGSDLHAGNWVRTGSQSEAELRFDSGTIQLYENTVLEIPTQPKNKAVSRSPETLKNVILQKGHSLVKIIKNRLNGRFEVITPNLIAGVKGTVFDIVDNEDLKGVFVSEGIVEVGSRQYPDEMIDIPSNHFTLLINDHLSDIREMQAEIENLDDHRLDLIPNLGDAKNSPERPDLDYLIEKLEDTARLEHRAEQAELKVDLKAQRAELKADLKAERADLKDDLKAERADLKDDLQAERADLRDDLQAEREELKDDLKADRTDIKDEVKTEREEMKDDLKADRDEMLDDLMAEGKNPKNDRRTD